MICSTDSIPGALRIGLERLQFGVTFMQNGVGCHVGNHKELRLVPSRLGASHIGLTESLAVSPPTGVADDDCNF